MISYPRDVGDDGSPNYLGGGLSSCERIGRAFQGVCLCHPSCPPVLLHGSEAVPFGNLRGNPSSSRLGAQVWGGHQKTCFSPNSGFMCDIFFHDLPFPEKAIKKQSKWQFCFGHVILGFETSPVDATFKHIKAPKAYWDQTDCSEVWLGRGQIQSWHGFRFRFMVMDCRNIILLFLNVLTHQSSINGLYISDTSWLKV